LEYILFISN